MSRTREVDGQLVVMDYPSPRITAEVYECGLPLTFDQYNKCAFNCQYCFAAFIAGAESHRGSAKLGGAKDPHAVSKYRNPVRSVDPDRVKRYWTNAGRAWSDKVDQLIVNLIRQRTPLHWGGLCDPFDPFERRFKVGLELLQFFRAIDYPVVFSTKGSLMREDPWASTLRGGNFRFQFSITTLDPAKGKVCDSGVGTPQERLDNIRFAVHELGCPTTLRLRPIIPGFISAEECCDLIRLAHEAGATGVSTEFFCLEMRGEFNRDKYRRMSAAIGFDLLDFYKRHSPGASGYLRLNRALKERFFVPMSETAAKLGMRFSVSDKHFKELGTVGGCCGIFWDDEGFGEGESAEARAVKTLRDGREPVHVNLGTNTYAMILAKRNGRVTWSELEPHLDWARVQVRSGGLSAINTSMKLAAARKNQTLLEVLRSYWNDPNHSKSPYHYSSGKVVPEGVDANGDIVYVYRPEGFEAPGLAMDEDGEPLIQLRRKDA